MKFAKYAALSAALMLPGLAFGQTYPAPVLKLDNSTVTATGGTTARSLGDRFAITANVLDFGAKCDGSTNDSAAFQAAFNKIASGGQVIVPSGVCILSTALTQTISAGASVSIVGQGADVTQLKFVSGINGVALTLGSMASSFHIRDLTLATSGSVTSTTGLSATLTTAPNPAAASPSDITNVTLRGSDGYASAAFWDTGIYINGASNISYTNVNVIGNAGASAANCIRMFGTASATSVVHNFTGGNFSYCANGAFADAYTQGVTFSQVNFTGDQYGIYEPAGTGTTQLTVMNSQFNDSKVGIYDHGGVQDTFIGNLFIIYGTSAIGIDLLTSGGTLVSNNTFSGNNSTSSFGLQIEANGNVSITNNYFMSLTPFWFSTGSTGFTTILAGGVYNTGAARYALAPGSTHIADYPQAFATLTPCAAAVEGREAMLTDSTTATAGATIAGGGANHVRAYCNATAWVVL